MSCLRAEFLDRALQDATMSTMVTASGDDPKTVA